MSIMYAVVDDTRRQFFELGKGPWGELFDRTWTYDDSEAFEARVFELWGGEDEYIWRVAKRLRCFCETAGWDAVKLVNDEGDEYPDENDYGDPGAMPRAGWEKCGSRYHGIGAEAAGQAATTP